MRKVILPLLGISLMLSCKQETKLEQIKYPESKKVKQVDNYHGTEVSDPYRWLEIDTAKEVEEWVDAQNSLTFSYLEEIPYRDKFRYRLEKVFNYERYSSPIKAGNYYFFYKNDGLQNQSVIYIQEGLDGEPTVFLDPNKLSKDGTVTANIASISDDDKYVVIRINRSGSDWTEFKVREIATNKELSDHVKWAKFTGASWFQDGFFYSGYGLPDEGTEYSAKNEFHKIYYHKLGTDQSEDKLIYEDKEHALRNHYSYTTEDDAFLIVSGSEGTYGNNFRIKSLASADAEFQQITSGFVYEYSVLAHQDNKLYVYTNRDADNFKVVAIDLANPEPKNWSTVIPEKEQNLASVRTAGGYLVASYLKDVASQVILYNMDGEMVREVAVPELSSVGGFGGKMDAKEVFYSCSSYLIPPSIYKYNLETGESTVFKQADTGVDFSQFTMSQVFYPSKDGTKIPMTLVHKKDLALDGSNPTLLYGYGGFSISITPSYRSSIIPILEQGAIYAVANLRGGTEYGEKWHKAGMLFNKQNVFDDFISAGEFLIKEGYTSKDKLAISGRSNGGLLVGACMTQRPDLYKVAFPAVGVLDMLRYHKFTIGWAWASEYGSSEEPDHFKNLYAYSPLHNVKAVDYPSTMITTADHDDRVVPAHSFKFAAELQDKHTGADPVLIRIDKKAGHGAGKPISKTIDELADLWSFMFYEMGYKSEDLDL